ncbi:MAG TPA: EamA family transporter [Chloroflexota bacterium]|nr:EamA family transporter [Chloroflexota bacterium]
MSLAFIGVYVLLVGIASFAEKPVSGRLDAYQLTAALTAGTLAAAVPALLLFGTWNSLGVLALGAGIGIGIIKGIGSALYCFAVERVPLWFAASFSNAYVIITAALGVIVLHEPLTITKAAGLLLTIAGIVLLSVRGRSGHENPRHALRLRPPIFCLIGYVAIVGAGTFLEKPALHVLAPLQLNALVAGGAVVAALAAFLALDRAAPGRLPSLGGAGVGALVGIGGVFYYLALAHLAVSVAATLSNSYVLVPVVLGILVLHEEPTLLKGIGMALMLTGVILMTVRI